MGQPSAPMTRIMTLGVKAAVQQQNCTTCQIPRDQTGSKVAIYSSSWAEKLPGVRTLFYTPNLICKSSCNYFSRALLLSLLVQKVSTINYAVLRIAKYQSSVIKRQQLTYCMKIELT